MLKTNIFKKNVKTASKIALKFPFKKSKNKVLFVSINEVYHVKINWKLKYDLVSWFYVFFEISWFFCEEEKKHFFQKVSKVPKKSKKSSKNFPICRWKSSKSGSEKGKNGEKIVKNVKKCRPKNFQFADQIRQKRSS